MKERVLVLGVGNSLSQKLKMTLPGETLGDTFAENFKEVWTIDVDPECKPMILWDLEHFPWPAHSEYFDEVHAYEVLEHLGAMGDYEFFFSLWKEIWRVLKPKGLLCASTPWWESVWAWQDPGHRRVYSPALLSYLSQEAYTDQIGRTAMTDYRRVFPPPYNFIPRYAAMSGTDPKNAGFNFVLQKEGSLQDAG